MTAAMPSLDDLEALMAARLAESGLAAQPSVARRSNPDSAPLSYGQRYVWAHHRLNPDGVAYNMCLAMTFSGRVDDAALLSAFEHLAQRHEALRTTYHINDDGDPIQRVHASLAPRTALVDLRDRPDSRAAAAQLADAAAVDPFDLERDSSLRVTVARVADDEVVAIVVVQHIAWDGMTMPALAPDVEAFYRHLTEGEPLQAPLDLQVADYAEAEQKAEPAEESREYWTSQFADVPPRLALPFRRGADVTEAGERLDRVLSDEADRNLRELAPTLSVTSYTIFLSAYYLALRAVTGSDEFVVGSTVANREEPGMDRLIGNFSNTLGLRLNSGAASTFADVVAHVGDVVTQGFTHKQYPFERLPNTSGEQLFDTLVLFLNQSIAGPQLPGATTQWRLVDNKSALLPLAVEVFLLDDHTDVQLTYQTDRLDASVVERLADYIDRILAMAGPTTMLDDLLALTPNDARRVSNWARGPRAVIVPETLDAMIANSVRRCPDESAVVSTRGEMTYAQFDIHVNRVGRLLRERGVANESIVAVVAQRSEWLPIVAAAILRLGAVYLPINPDQPSTRIQLMLDDAAPRVVVSSMPEIHPALDADVVNLWGQAGFDAIDSYSDSRVEPDRRVHPLDAAYLVYTSGTTGVPKAVVNNHISVASHIQWLWQHFGAGSERILQKAPIGFDVGVAEIFNALTTGSAVVMPPPEFSPADVGALAHRLQADRVTMLSLVPSILSAFLEDEAADGRPSALRGVSYLLLGGEAVLPSLVERARDACGGTVVGLYGPTEAAMDIMCEDFIDDVSGTGEALIGVPEANSDVYVLDQSMRPTPPGVAGELYLAGVQLARGYHRRAGLTASTFVACPFGDRAGERMYRTGDVVRWSESGHMEYLGRSGDQVKIRGNRVELGEVESSICAIDGVARAVPAAVDNAGVATLVAYFTRDASGSELLSESDIRDDIRAQLRQRVPEYMVPSVLVELAEIPLTTNGKVDKSKLPAPNFGSTAGSGRALETASERAVADVLAAVIGLPDATSLRADDDFLMLGGDSIAAIRLVSQLKRRGLHVATPDVLTHRTIGAIAAAVHHEEVRQVVADGETGFSPLTALGRALTGRGGDYSSFSLATALVTPADATAERIGNIVQQVVAAHPMLSARIVESDGALGYFTGSSASVRVDVVESDDVSSTLDAEVKRQSATLDPTRGVMVAFTWIPAADAHGRGRLLIVAHHLVIDGVSWRILHDDLSAAWNGESITAETTSTTWWNRRVAVETPESPVQPVASALALPRVIDGGLDTVATVAELSVSVDAETLDALSSDVAEAFGCEIVDLQAAALAYALSPGGGEVSLITESHGRTTDLDVDLTATVGWFTTARQIVVETSGLDAAVSSAKEARLGPIVPASATIPDVTFNYMGRFTVPDAASAQDWSAAPEFGYLGGFADPTLAAPAALDVNTVIVAGAGSDRLDASFRFPAGLLDEDAVRTVSERWAAALSQLVEVVRHDARRRLSPSDVTAAFVTQSDIDTLTAQFGPLQDLLPLSPMQSGLYFAALASAGRDAYSVQTIITVRGDVDAERLAAAINQVVDDHPHLAISVALSESGQPVGAIPISRRDVDVDVVAGHVGSVADFLAVDLRRQFDLRAALPLLRCSVLNGASDLETGVAAIVLTAHHILTDGWSGSLLPVEIFRAYAGAELAPEADVYPEFLRRTVDDSAATQSAWSNYLVNVTPRLVAPQRAASDHGAQARTQIFDVEPNVVAALGNLAVDVGVTVNRVYEVAWAAVLSQLTGADDSVFGEVVSGRPADLVGADQSIGCYANTLPVSVRLPASSTWRGVVDDLRERSLRVLGHDQLPLAAAHRMVGTRQLFDSMFVFQSYPANDELLSETLAAVGLELVATDGGGATDNALLVMVFPAGSVLGGDTTQITVTYDVEEFDDEEAALIERVFQAVLTAMANQPDSTLAELRLDPDDSVELEERRMWQ